VIGAYLYWTTKRNNRGHVSMARVGANSSCKHKIRLVVVKFRSNFSDTRMVLLCYIQCHDVLYNFFNITRNRYCDNCLISVRCLVTAQ
jgi:hypothetical protein